MIKIQTLLLTHLWRQLQLQMIKTSARKFWKYTHAKHVLLVLYITHLVACQCSLLHARANESNSAVTIIANKMDANNKTAVSKSTWNGWGGGVYIDQCMIHCTRYHTSIETKALTCQGHSWYCYDSVILFLLILICLKLCFLGCMMIMMATSCNGYVFFWYLS